MKTKDKAEIQAEKEMDLIDGFVKTILPTLCEKYLPDTFQSDKEMCGHYVRLADAAYSLGTLLVAEREGHRLTAMDVFSDE
jgi:hypothetical protein